MYFHKIIIFFKKRLQIGKTLCIIIVQTKYRGMEQLVARRAHNPKVVGSSPSPATKKSSFAIWWVRIFLFDCGDRFCATLYGLWDRRANNSKGEVVVNDSTVYCQSHRADRSIFSAEKIQDRWFKVSATASVGASVLCTEVSSGHPHPSPATKKTQFPVWETEFFIVLQKKI